MFTDKCSTCHKVGEIGKGIGPELTLIRKKFDRQALIDAIVNPSAGILFGYDGWTINTEDGQSHNGLLIAESKDVIVIKDLAGNKNSIPVKRIASRQKSEKSIMPEALSLGLSDQEIADITNFLLQESWCRVPEHSDKD